MRPKGSRRWVVPGLAFGAGAFLLNLYLLVPIYGSLNLHFGVALALLCMLLYGARSAMLAAILSGVGLTVSLGLPSMIPLQVFEVAILALLVARGWPLVVASLFYWLLLGLPLAYLFARFTVDIPTDYFLIAVTKQAINGLFNASLASAAHLALARRFGLSDGVGGAPTLRYPVFSLVAVCIVLPSLLLSLILTNRSIERFAEQLERRLIERAESYAERVEQHVAEHRDAIATIARLHSRVPDLDLAVSLAAVQQSYSGFITLLAADHRGVILNGAPQAFFDRLRSAPPEARVVSDRPYFSVPRETGQPFVSEAFRGRGFGNDPIVAVSAPLFDPSGAFSGIIEGSLDLPNFARLEADRGSAAEPVVILDSAGRVVFSSEVLDLPTLSTFDPSISTRYVSVRIGQLRIGDQRFLFETATTPRGWTVHALSLSDQINALIRRDMLLLAGSLIGLIALFMIVSQIMVRGLTRPLSELTRQLLSSSDGPIRLSGRGVETREIKTLADSLEQARALSAEFQSRLETEVELKTDALRSANLALERQAAEDALTGLLNRRGFWARCQAMMKAAANGGQRLGLALIDLDHFKQINDRYGHPGGDACLTQFAHHLMAAFDRSSDVVARTGGEEFAVLVADGCCEQILARLEALRVQLAESSIEFDGCEIKLTFSAGFLCQNAAEDLHLSDLLQIADALLYDSKHGGRNRVTSRTLS